MDPENIARSIDAASKALGRPIDTVCGFMESLLGQPCKIAGDTLADWISCWQWENRLKIIDRVDRIMADRGIAKRTLQPDFTLRFFRDCGDATSETLQDAWDRLLAAAIEDQVNEHVAFVNTLQSLDSIDVKVLACMIEIGYIGRDERAAAISQHLGIPLDRVRLSLDNFQHLGLFTPAARGFRNFGIRFVGACMRDGDALKRFVEAQRKAGGHLLRD